MEEYVVYIYRNKINGKIYIGQSSNPQKRCSESNYKGSTYFYHAIQKYGFENFEQLIVKRHLDKDIADYWEKLLIEFFNSTNNDYGYNLAEGGSCGCILSKEKNGFYNRRHSLESIKKMKEKKIGGNNPLAKPVICINTGEIFPSAREATNWCGASRQHINRVCRGERKHTGTHPNTGELLEWRYYYNEF